MNNNQNLLNIGCGQHFHSDWKNVDFVSVDPAVEQRDLRQGLGETAESFAMVYHSHVLEHFSPDQGRQLLKECFRVLKPGGILRVAVPDLEQIAKLYLENLAAAWNGNSNAAERYQWMKLELLDQMTRHQSGGSMGPFMVSADGEVADFLNQRLGREVSYAKAATSGEHDAAQEMKSRTVKSSFVVKLKRKALKWLIGKSGLNHLEIGKFRDSGEVHRWMYDRYSLRQICTELGFEHFVVRSATESYLDGFASFELDCVKGRIRKPDSLFIECRKPANIASQRQVA